MEPSATTHAGADYARKPATYFADARKPFIDMLPAAPEARLLEIGCGNGDASAYALASGRCGWCAGVELCAKPAAEASRRMNHVLVADIEHAELPYPKGHFDALVMCEVLEHLRDPWSVLRKLRPFLKPGAWVVAGSPNVSHHSVIRMLLRGDWNYAQSGIMDATHLRWFTPRTYRQMFEECGFRVVSVSSPELSLKARWVDRLTLRRFTHLFQGQIRLLARHQ